jgi:hypothetical protein
MSDESGYEIRVGVKAANQTQMRHVSENCTDEEAMSRLRFGLDGGIPRCHHEQVLEAAHAVIKDRALELDTVPAAKVRRELAELTDRDGFVPNFLEGLRKALPENADPAAYQASAAGKLAALIEGLDALSIRRGIIEWADILPLIEDAKS